MAVLVDLIGSDGGDDYTTIALWEDDTDGPGHATDNIFGLLRGEAHTGAGSLAGGPEGNATSQFRMLTTIDDSHNFDHTDPTAADSCRIVITGGGFNLAIDDDFTRIGGSFSATDDVDSGKVVDETSTGSIGLSGVSDAIALYVPMRWDGATQIGDAIVVYDVENNDRIRAHQTGSGDSVTLTNCLVFDVTCDGASDSASAFHSTTAGNMKCFNCTCYNMDGVGGTDFGFFGCQTNNCYAGDVASPWGGTSSTSGTTGDNASDDTTTKPGSHEIDDAAGGDQFVSVTVGSEDFNLKSGSDIADQGVDAFGIDWDLVTESGIADRDDIGCLEFVSAGGRTTKNIRSHPLGVQAGQNKMQGGLLV